MKEVNGYIERKSMLYKTGVEYGDYTMNHVLGCAHGCKYPCYAFLMARRFGKVDSYEKWLEPFLVKNTLKILDKEIPRLKARIKSVQLCFTTARFATAIFFSSSKATRSRSISNLFCVTNCRSDLIAAISSTSDRRMRRSNS